MSTPHDRLSEAMRKRGLELGKRWVHIAREAEITTSALGGIRRGEYRPSAHTARALDSALEWEAGSVEAILDGGEPTPVTDSRRGGAPTAPPVRSEIAEVIEAMEANPELAHVMVQLIRQVRGPASNHPVTEDSPERDRDTA